MRLRIDLAYDGGDFHGWAAQPGLRTVQGDLEAALATVLRVGAVSVVCAGRTDTGVHARGQVVHLDVEPEALAAVAVRYDGDPCDALARRLDGLLPADLRVRRVVAAPDGFDARFSPLWRRYVYRVTDGVPDPLTRGHVLAWPRPVDVDARQRGVGRPAGAARLRGVLQAARGRDHGPDPARPAPGPATATWSRGTVRADAFCHHMVRSLVGCLLTVGEGRRPIAWAGEVLAAAVRDPAVTVVPPHGLTLEEVGYPPDADLAVRAGQTRTRRAM